MTTLVATWSEGLFAVTGDACTQEIEGQPVRELAPDGRGGALAIVGHHALCRRGPDGKWETISSSEFDLSCCVALQDTIYVGTDDARMLRLNHAGGALDPINGFNNVGGRNSWFAGSAIVNGERRGPPLGVRSVAANANGSVLFVNVHVGGIPRSLDGGKTWHPTIDINHDVHEVCAHHADPNLVAAASAVGLCISHDAGATWSIEQQGLHALHCSAVAFAGDDIAVSAATDPFAARSRVYRRSTKPDRPLIALEGGMPEWLDGIVDTGCIATNGSLVAVADRGGTLYHSGDFGSTWSRSSASLPAPSCILIC